MSPDRYGGETKPPCTDPRCGNGCPPKWIGHDEQGRPIPCLQCKPHLAKTRSEVADYAQSQPSARAQAAIEAAESDNR